MAQGLGARGHHRGHAPVQRLRPPVRAPPAPRSRARAAKFFSFVISNDPFESSVVVFENALRDDHPRPLSRSHVLAFSQVQARMVLLVVRDRLPQARGGRCPSRARARGRRPALGRVRPVRPLVAPVVRARQRPCVPGKGTPGDFRGGRLAYRRRSNDERPGVPGDAGDADGADDATRVPLPLVSRG